MESCKDGAAAVLEVDPHGELKKMTAAKEVASKRIPATKAKEEVKSHPKSQDPGADSQEDYEGEEDLNEIVFHDQNAL